MNANEEQTAQISADSLLDKLISQQPEFLKVSKLDEAGGRNAGDFIAALRARLYEMYLKTPN